MKGFEEGRKLKYNRERIAHKEFASCTETTATRRSGKFLCNKMPKTTAFRYEEQEGKKDELL